MNRRMLQANLVEPQRLLVQEVPIPEPCPGEVRIAVATCGICGSDIHAYYGEHPFISTPIVPGHEFSGLVDALGAGVSGLEPGTRVIVEPGLVCGECEMCRGGRYNICENLKVLGCQATGAMAEYVTAPARNVIPMPEDLTFEQGALVEPAAVAVHALRRADLSRVERILIIGCGPIGLFTLQVAAAWGIPTVVVTDVVDSRLSLARDLGATHAVNVGKSSLESFLAERFARAGAMDLVMECVGSEETLNQAIGAVKKGGQIVIVGVPAVDPQIRLSWIQDRELELKGTLMYMRSDFEDAMALIAGGKIRAEPLVSKRWPLSRIADAMCDLLANRDATIKTLITIREG